MKKNLQGPFTSKQENLEEIKLLHIKCEFLDIEHLFMIPKTWLEFLQYEEIDVEITDNLYNSNCTPKYIFVEKYLETYDPKIYAPCNYLQSFCVTDLIDEFRTNNKYPF